MIIFWGGEQGLIIIFVTNESSLFCKGNLCEQTHMQEMHFFHVLFYTYCRLHLRPVSNVVLQQCQTKLIELNLTLALQ